ncbi:MAG: hypothetical protein ACXV5T_03285 [Halobacteriota archaeon]
MDKRCRHMIAALIGVFILFAMLVPVYWTVSNGYPDGLEKLLEQQNVVAKGPSYSPPVAELQGYGATMPLYFLSGISGAILVLGILLLIGKIAKHSRREGRP